MCTSPRGAARPDGSERQDEGVPPVNPFDGHRHAHEGQELTEHRVRPFFLEEPSSDQHDKSTRWPLAPRAADSPTTSPWRHGLDGRRPPADSARFITALGADAVFRIDYRLGRGYLRIAGKHRPLWPLWSALQRTCTQVTWADVCRSESPRPLDASFSVAFVLNDNTQNVSVDRLEPLGHRGSSHKRSHVPIRRKKQRHRSSKQPGEQGDARLFATGLEVWGVVRRAGVELMRKLPPRWPERRSHLVLFARATPHHFDREYLRRTRSASVAVGREHRRSARCRGHRADR